MQRLPWQNGYLMFHKDVEAALMPTRAMFNSAGLDLYAAENVVIAHGTRSWVSTGISLQIPISLGMYGQIISRSGFAGKGIDTGAGLIDADYRGTIKVLLINWSGTVFHVEKGMRIAQMLIGVCWMGMLLESKEPFEQTERGNKGFGSSGV